MVVGALLSYFSPSNRGFVRIKDSENVPLDSYPLYNDPNNPQKPQPMTVRRRKPLRAMAVLTSIASDCDLISDWVFMKHSFYEDRQYREQYRDNPEEGALPYLIPKHLLISAFVSCILGTITWLVIATEGRVIAPIMIRLGVDKISMGLVLFLSVLVEDLPQIFLTFFIEDYYEEGGYLSEVAVFNLMASFYDTAIKLAESFDQRNDIVETGVWCKKSIRAHDSVVTDLLVIPNEIEMPSSDTPVRPCPKRSFPLSISKDRRCTSETLMKLARQQQSSRSKEMVASASSLPPRRASQTQLLVEAFFPEEEAVPPEVHFLTTSMDTTAKLWNVESMADANASPVSHKRECIRTYKDAESDGFTCLAWVGPRNPGEKTRVNHFLAGCNNGNTKLWDISGLCHRSYRWDETTTDRVASIAATYIDGKHTFICGHESGVIRSWHTWEGNCLGQIQGHTKRVTAIALLDNGDRFVSASVDGTIKLWESNLGFQQQKKEAHSGAEMQFESNDADPMNATSTPDTSKCLVLHTDDSMAVKQFLGHRAAVLSLVAVDDRAILSGSQDTTARLWSIESGLCLRVLSGHHGGVYSLLAIDRCTFLTGSGDETIKAWDALSGTCLRTYEGHKGAVTALSLGAAGENATEGSTAFISSSVDKSVKCWVLTTVSYRDPAATLDHILDIHENTCRCFHAATYECGPQEKGNLLRACSPDQCEFDHPYYYEGFQI